MKMVQRPLSPHLQAYRLPLAAIISITHRIVGAILFVVGIAVSLYCLLWLVGVNLIWADFVLFSFVGRLKLSFGVVLTVFYILAELRYILWGCNIGINNTFVRQSNGLILLGTGIISGICLMCIWGIRQ